MQQCIKSRNWELLAMMGTERKKCKVQYRKKEDPTEKYERIEPGTFGAEHQIENITSLKKEKIIFQSFYQ